MPVLYSLDSCCILLRVQLLPSLVKMAIEVARWDYVGKGKGNDYSLVDREGDEHRDGEVW